MTNNTNLTPTPRSTAPPQATYTGRSRWQLAQQVAFTVIGSFISALGFALFQIPFNLAAGGLAGIGLIVTALTGFPTGVFILLLNIPLLMLGFKHLGRWYFVALTSLSLLVFAVTTDALAVWLPTIIGAPTVTDDPLLAAIYAAIVTGIGYGLIYRGGANPGGTAVLARMVQKYTGIPLSQVFLYTDGLIVLVAGALFGWESALLAMLVLFLNGLASDYVIEGPGRVRTATIVTDHPQRVARALMDGLGKGVTRWEVTGSYTGRGRTMLFCTIYRSQVADLKLLLHEADPTAFAVIGVGHQAIGSQFQRRKTTATPPTPAAHAVPELTLETATATQVGQPVAVPPIPSAGLPTS